MSDLEIQLVPVGHPKPLPPQPVAGERFLVGRNKRCDLSLDDDSLSKSHCVIIRRDRQLLITDLGSRTGTRVNGTPLGLAETAPLQDGDLIQVGPYDFRLSIRDAQTGRPLHCTPAYAGALPYPLIALPDRRVDDPVTSEAEPVPAGSAEPTESVETPEPVMPDASFDSGEPDELVEVAEEPRGGDSPAPEPPAAKKHDPASPARPPKPRSSMGSSTAAQDALRKMFPGSKGK